MPKDTEESTNGVQLKIKSSKTTYIQFFVLICIKLF